MKSFIAAKTDDLEIRNLLANNPIPGNISLIYQKNPSFFQAVKVGNWDTKTIVIKNNSGKIVAFQTTAVRDIYLDGEIKKIGYLSNLRVDKKFQNKGVLKIGFDFFKKIDPEIGAPFYYSTIISRNKKALNVLVKQRSDGLKFVGAGTYLTKAVLILNKKKEVGNKYRIARGSDDNLEAVVDFLNKEGQNKNFYPHYKIDDFGTEFLKDFKIEDFYIVYNDKEMVGVGGKWDQSNFKQNIIYDYNFIFKFYNLAAKILKWPNIPDKGKQFKFIYLSFIAIKNNKPEILNSLIRAVYNDLIGKKYLYLVFGLHKKDPLIKSLKGFFYLTYKSKLFINYWQKPEILKNFNLGIPYLELSTL